MPSDMEHTLASSATLEGTSLHTGEKVTLTIKPAPAGHGFKFRRIDLPDKPFIDADVARVETVERATTLSVGSVRVHTVEHVISALTGMGVDNALIEMDANEPPIGDGSAKPYVELIKKAGLEVKVERSYYKLVPVDADQAVAGSKGQALTQKVEKYKRVAIKSGDEVVSGDLIEVELSIESKNDYSYLVFEDWKAAGLEPVEVRSGYNPNGLGAFMELRDEKVAMFVRSLPRGRHNLSYRLRAEIPGKFSALPTRAEAMYAPELKANSDELKIRVRD